MDCQCSCGWLVFLGTGAGNVGDAKGLRLGTVSGCEVTMSSAQTLSSGLILSRPVALHRGGRGFAFEVTC